MRVNEREMIKIKTVVFVLPFSFSFHCSRNVNFLSLAEPSEEYSAGGNILIAATAAETG